jgi:hypothetical protein
MSNDPTKKYAALLEENPLPKKARTRMTKRDPSTGLKEVRKVSIFFAEEEDCVYREAIRPYLCNGGKGWQGALERLISNHTRIKSIPQYGTAAEFEALTEAAQTAQLKIEEQAALIEEQAAQIAAHAAEIKVLEGILDRALAAKMGGQS